MDDIIQKIKKISKNAGKKILRHYDTPDENIKYKADKSPLTKADLESEEYITSFLREEFDKPVISEESAIKYPERKGWEEFWLVDPLDGTRDFMEKNGEFTVNIALIKDRKPVLGAIYCPAADELYYAAKNYGAYIEKNGKALPIKNNGDNGQITATGSRQHSTDTDMEFFRINRIEKVVPRGSSLKFCAVSRGEATIYSRFQGSMEWDIAAGHIIAKESRCHIIDLMTAEEPEYNKEELNNNFFIVHSPAISGFDLLYPDISGINERFKKIKND